MASSSYRSPACNTTAINMSSSLAPLLLLLLLVTTQITLTRSAWVQDYASNHGCGETAVAELCDPDDAAANRACRDACHYSGCRGGGCVHLDGGSGSGSGDAMAAARGCHCLP